jgi:hypothetical protein
MPSPAVHHAAHGKHTFAGRNYAVQRRLVNLVLQATILTFELVNGECPIDNQPQNIGINRLLVKVVGSLCHSIYRNPLIHIVNQNDNFRMRGNPEYIRKSRNAAVRAFIPRQ